MRAALVLVLAIGCAAGGTTVRRLPHAEDGAIRLVTQALLPASGTVTLAATDDGRLAMVGLGDDGAVAVWDLRQRQLLRVFRVHGAPIRAVAIAGGRGWAAAANGTLCAFDLARVEVERCLRVEPGPVVAAGFRADGERAALAVDRGERTRLVLVDTTAGTVVDQRDLDWTSAAELAFSPDGKYLVLASDFHVAVLDDHLRPRWDDWASGGYAFAAGGLLVGDDGALEQRDLATGAPRGRHAAWDVDPTRPQGTVLDRPHLVGITAAGGDRVAIQFDGEQSIALQVSLASLPPPPAEGTLAPLPPPPPAITARGAPVHRFVYAAGAGVLVGVSLDGRELMTWRVEREALLDRFTAPVAAVTAAAFTPDGLLVGGLDSIARFDPATGAMTVHSLPGPVEHIAGSGDFAVIARGDGAELWHLGPGGPTALRDLGDERVHGFACRLRGAGCKLFVDDRIEDAATGTQQHRVRDGSARDLTPSADARRFVYTTYRDEVTVVDTTNRQRIGTVELRRPARALALSDDGRLLAIGERAELSTDEATRVEVIDVATGRERAAFTLDRADIGAMVFAPDGAALVVGAAVCPAVETEPACHVWRLDLATRRAVQLGDHGAPITSASVSADGRHAVTTSLDGTARIWRLDGTASVGLVLSGDRWVMYTDDGLFDGSRRGGALVSAVKGDHAFPLDQFAGANDRPDLVLARMGFGRDDVLRYFVYRHVARAKRLGLPTDRPERAFEGNPVVTVDRVAEDGPFARVQATITAVGSPIARYQIWVDQVPVFPGDGVEAHGDRIAIDEPVPLTVGDNRIEIGATSEAGVASLRAMRTAHRDGPDPGTIYFVALGVSDYVDPDLELDYPAQDAIDLTALFARLAGRPMHAALVDRDVTVAALDEVKRYLARATVDDTVIVFVAGHGFLSPDARAEFLFAPHDYDPARPAETGIPLSRFEEVLAGVRARRRLLLLDACLSGERDEDQFRPSTTAARGLRPRVVRIHDVPGAPATPSAPLPREYLLDRDRLIFQDGTRSTGVVVVGSSRWNELSWESPSWGHGAFAAELLRVFADPAADRDHDQRLSIDELVRAVQAGVADLTDGFQHPTLARDNPDAALSLPLDPGP